MVRNAALLVAHPPLTAAEVCTQVNHITRQIARLDVVAGRYRDELHRTNIARAALVNQRGELVALAAVAGARESSPPEGPVVIGPACNLPRDAGAAHPRSLVVDRDCAAGDCGCLGADEQAHRPHVRHLDRSTSQLQAGQVEYASDGRGEVDEPFDDTCC